MTNQIAKLFKAFKLTSGLALGGLLTAVRHISKPARFIATILIGLYLFDTSTHTERQKVVIAAKLEIQKLQMQYAYKLQLAARGCAYFVSPQGERIECPIPGPAGFLN